MDNELCEDRLEEILTHGLFLVSSSFLILFTIIDFDFPIGLL